MYFHFVDLYLLSFKYRSTKTCTSCDMYMYMVNSHKIKLVNPQLDNQESEDEDNSVEPLLEQEAPTSTRRRSDHSSRSGDSDGGGSDGEGRRDDSDPVDDIQ